VGGPFRAIVGGAQQTMSFAPAQAIQLDNYSTQYGHLRKTDVFVAPGQIGMVILVDGISSEIFAFEPPPGASQAAATQGQICLVRTYDEAAGPGAPPPLAPGVGVLLPIGLDSPQHFHHFTGTHAHNPHLHAHSATHHHDISAASHFHTDVHNHPISTITSTGGGVQGVSGTLATLDHIHNSFGTVADVTGNFTGNTGTVNFGNTADAAPGNTDNANVPPASPGDSDLENVQHTHP
jgi:hypothetical protein